MSAYDFAAQFRALHQSAMRRYTEGRRDADGLVTVQEAAFLASIGSRPQDMLDYAEDAVRYGEPDGDTALLIQAVRRDYFLIVQRGHPSASVIDPALLPAKTDTVRGIEWLPRLLPKARAKLRGELPESLMYGCGGDRKFFRSHGIHPAEFLARVWHAGSDDAAVIDWVAALPQAS